MVCVSYLAATRPKSFRSQLLTRLRTDTRTEFTPVIAISGHGAEEELQQYRHGFAAVLPKPFSTNELLACVSRILHLRTDPDSVIIHLGFESQDRDYKESIDLASKEGVAALAKDVIAMANHGGGTIIIGVREIRPGEFMPEGVPDEMAEALETSRINRTLRPYLDPPVAVASRRVRDGSRLFIFLEVPSAVGSLILVAKQNEKAGLYPGRIYTRTSAAESAEVRTAAELRALLERLSTRGALRALYLADEVD